MLGLSLTKIFFSMPNHKQEAGVSRNEKRNMGCFTFSFTFFLLQKILEFSFLKTWRYVSEVVYESIPRGTEILYILQVLSKILSKK